MTRAMRLLLPAAFLLASAGSSPLHAWGYVAHRIIAENAAAGMPDPLAAFFRSGSRSLSAASIEPDTKLKSKLGETEKRRHYLDLEDLGDTKQRGIPSDPQKARELYGSATLEQAGMLPWRVAEVHAELTAAMKRNDWPAALRLAGWLSHYVSDACQPLHTTVNFDGQKSGSRGIHAAFETEMIDGNRIHYRQIASLPEGFRPEPIADPAGKIIEVILEAHKSVAGLLKADRDAVLAMRRSRADYWKELEKRAGPIAGRQMALATRLTASYWHSAWVAAGRPVPPGRAPRLRAD